MPNRTTNFIYVQNNIWWRKTLKSEALIDKFTTESTKDILKVSLDRFSQIIELLWRHEW